MQYMINSQYEHYETNLLTTQWQTDKGQMNNQFDLILMIKL